MKPFAGHRRRMLGVAIVLGAITLAAFAANLASPTEQRVLPVSRLVGVYALAGVATACVMALIALGLAWLSGKLTAPEDGDRHDA